MDANNKTIRFIDSNYKELFRIPDGASIKITFPPDDIRGFAVRECKYIDEHHFEIRGNGSDIYHICQFAELMEKMGAKYEPAVQLQNAELVPFVSGEEKFLTYNREEENSCIGHIAGDFGQQGDRFHGSWADRKNDRNTTECQAELHSAVYALRQGALKDHGAMLEYCRNHPEARLSGREHLEHYGFKLETETRQYFVFCAAEPEPRDSRFIVYAYDKEAPVIEQNKPLVEKTSSNVKTYTLDELIKKGEPQARSDKALIGRCVYGLGLYAAQIAEENRHSSKITEMRNLAETLVGYWELDDNYLNTSAKPLEEFMQSFDDRVNEARTGGAITGDVYQTAPNVIYGLFRYGEDMVVGQGAVAMEDIIGISELIDDIAEYWGFEMAVADDLTNRLETAVRGLLKETQLPGQPVSGENVNGYVVSHAVLFGNDRGFALAHNLNAAEPFVTWQFTNDNGKPDYYWGKYYGSEEKAQINYVVRSTEYRDSNGLKEKPLPFGQDTHAIPVEIMTKSQPLVTVTFSEHDKLRGVEKMPLYLANTLFFETDEKQQSDYIASGRTIAPYLKTDFRIDFIINGKPDSYHGRYDVGSGDQTLTEHILDYAEYYRNDEDYQQFTAETKSADVLTEENAKRDFIINELVPFFDKHCEISKNEAWALSEIMTIHDKANGQPSEADTPRIAYLDSVIEHAWQSRTALNATGLDSLPKAPAPFTEKANKTTIRDSAAEKPSVMDEIKAAQKTQKEQPHTPKPGLGKKKTAPDL